MDNGPMDRLKPSEIIGGVRGSNGGYQMREFKIVPASSVSDEDVLSGKVASAFSRAEQAIPKRESRLSVAWPTFAQKLASALEILVEDQFLIISVKHSNQYIQFAAQGSFGLRMETTSNSYLAKSEQLNERQIADLIDAGWHVPSGTPADASPENDPDGSPNFFVEFAAPVSCEAVAALAIRTLSEILRVPHPAFLQYRAIDDTEGKWAAIELPDLGLKIDKPAQQTNSNDDLPQLLLATLKETTGISDLDFDSDGDIGLRYGSAVTFVRLLRDSLYVRIYSPILREVEECPGIFARLNDINANETLMRFIFRNGVLYCVADVSAVPFVSDHIAQAFVHFCAIADGMDSLLREEFGGQTAFDDLMPSSLKH
jgi:hypothetical protein